jgi:hypothetical protein
MKRIFLFITVFLFYVPIEAQKISDDFKTLNINKQVREFEDKFDLSSVLSAIVTLNYVDAYGRSGLYSKLCVKRNTIYWPSANTPDTPLPLEKKNEILNHTICKIIVYKDSVACAIVKENKSYFSIRWYEINDNKWLAAGEDGRPSIEDGEKLFIPEADGQLQTLRRVNVVSNYPTDTLSFVSFLQKNQEDPTKFILDALKKYQIVIYGEIHNRPTSWGLCRNVIRQKAFAESTGTVFLELSAHKQDQLNQFLDSKKLNTDLILDVFRESFDLEFWAGMYDFLIDIWNINQSLPPDKRIKVIAADIPRPYSTFKMREDFQKYFQNIDRDQKMAEVVENYIRTKTDPRNCLFIVGAMHVCKSIESAGGLLVKKLTSEKVFTIFTHCPVISNRGDIPGLIRNGIYDEAFLKTGNYPMAFKLDNGPFAVQPFDAFPEIRYKGNTGNFSDNYDGYIFLGPLDFEISDRILFEAYTADFIKELKRRCDIEKIPFERLYGISEPSQEAFFSALIKEKEPYLWNSRLQLLK